MLRTGRIPPTDPRPEEMIITRQPFFSWLILYVPNGNSYRITSEEVELYLRLLGCAQPERIVRLAWSFYAVHVCTETWVATSVPKAAVDERIRDGIRNRTTEFAASSS